MGNTDAPSKLQLTNDGTLTFFFIGVGSAFTKVHYQTNLLLIKGEDHLLIDCGTKASQAFFELGLPITEVRNFFITHSHADHIGGLEEVMLMGRYAFKRKPNIVINSTYQHLLWDLSLRGGAAFNEETNSANLSFGDLWNVIKPRWLSNCPRETFEANVGSINIKFFRTKHIPELPTSWESSFWSCGLLIDNRILFTGDTRFDPELIESFCSLFPVEVIFHDCQFYTGGVHTSLDELCTLPEEIRKKMYLVHYGDNFKDFIPKIEEYQFLGLTKQWHYYPFPAP